MLGKGQREKNWEVKTDHDLWAFVVEKWAVFQKVNIENSMLDKM